MKIFFKNTQEPSAYLENDTELHPVTYHYNQEKKLEVCSPYFKEIRKILKL